MSSVPSFFAKLGQKYKQLPKYQRYIGISITLYLTWTLLLGLLLPYLLTQQIPKQLSNQIQRPVSLTQVKINPFTLEVELTDFAIKEKDDQPFVGFKRLGLNIQFWDSLFQQGLSLTDITLENPHAEVKRLDSEEALRFNFSDILETLAKNSEAQPETEPEPEGAKTIPHFILKNLAIVDANLHLLDEITQGEVSYPKVNLNVASFDSHNPIVATKMSSDAAKPQPIEGQSVDAKNEAAQKANRYHMEFHSDRGGKIALKGQVQLTPFELVGDVRLSRIDLPQLWAFVDKAFHVSLDKGYVDFATEYRVAMDDDQLEASTSAGELSFSELLITHEQRELISLGRFALSGIAADLGQQQIDVAALTSSDLLVNARLDDKGVDLAALLAPKASGDKSPTEVKTDNATSPDAVANQNSNEQTSREQASSEQASSEPAAGEQVAKTDTSTETNTGSKPDTETGSNTDTKTDSQAPSWHAKLEKISLSNYQLNLTEQLFKEENLWQIGQLQLTTGAVDESLSQPIDYQLALAINQSAKVQSQGQIDALAKQVSAELSLDGLSLNWFQNYIAPIVNIKIDDGRLATSGQLLADANGKLNYQGTLQVDDLQVKDLKANKTLVKWQQLDLNQLDFDKEANKLAIDQVTLNKPYGRILINEDRTTNFQDLLVAADDNASADDSAADADPSGAAKPATRKNDKQENDKQEKQAAKKKAVAQTADAAKPMALSINKIVFKDGSTFFADNSLTPNFAASIEQLEGNIANLSSSSDKAAKVDIKGKIDRYAPVVLKGEVNPLLEQPYLDLDLSFKHVELTSVNPYSGTYAGYYIDKGLMSLDLKYQLENNQLVGDNHLVVDQLQLGKKSNSSLATSLPVTLAIALLQDRHGVIDLGLQVSGDLNEPSFSFGSIIATAFTNVITKAVTAPFSLLAGLLGSDDELDKVAFTPGLATLPEESQSLLSKLAKGLADRPKLTVSAKGAVDPVSDSQALMTAKLHQALIAQAQLDDAKFTEAQMPAELTASTFPTTGILSDALKSLYEKTLQKDPGEVLKEIKQQLAQQDNSAGKNSAEKLSDEELQTRWHIALYNYLVSAQQLDDNALGQLAQSRALAVKQYLIEEAKIEPGRVFVLDSQAALDTSAPQALLTLSAE
ncbi:DUF748 domain-containing protein [Shewanella halotolerans]|uniref:DUF748 domain-containing protein n=1 Tax=Shewanella halotolerans TaxID=2864204 RepID=UPI001C655B80|nr:DUF748 domain-containing protein [Shewanella halotolerans]QYJ88603.1 DUF748 domain-containing protein [Shewanella halotolerans]